MNLTLRARIFIIISLAVLLILGISLFLVVFYKDKPATEGEQSAIQTQTENIFDDQTGVLINSSAITPTVIDESLPIAPLNTREQTEKVVQNIAKVFVERYGSYSTDNPGQNLKDLEILSTPDLWIVLKTRINNLSVGEEFSGFTTRAFGSSLISFEEDKAMVRVITAREENKNGEIINFNQEAEVTLLKSGENWLVDDVKWK